MNPSVAQSLSTVTLLASVDAAATANATGFMVDISAWDGAIVITQNCGILDGGSLTGSIQTGDDSSGTDAADITGGAFTAVTTSTDPASQSIVIMASQCKKYIRYVGTIVTGGALIGVTAVGTPKIV